MSSTVSSNAAMPGSDWRGTSPFLCATAALARKASAAWSIAAIRAGSIVAARAAAANSTRPRTSTLRRMSERGGPPALLPGDQAEGKCDDGDDDRDKDARQRVDLGGHANPHAGIDR